MTIQAGKLDRTIDFQRQGTAQDPTGQVAPAWQPILTAVKAEYDPINGTERFTADQWVAYQQVRFTVRWNSTLAGVNPKDRIIYPAGSTARNAIYEIIDAQEIGRREGLSFATARRAEP
jgi:SPP1 family predicted phage head-tail adaptor